MLSLSNLTIGKLWMIAKAIVVEGYENLSRLLGNSQKIYSQSRLSLFQHPRQYTQTLNEKYINDTYVEYKSEKDEKSSIAEYLAKNRSHLRDFIDDQEKSGE